MKLKQKLRAVKSPPTMTNIIKVVLCCLVFHGCNEDPSMFEDTDLHETDSKFVNPLDFIGQSHNQGLDYIFNNLETPDKGLKSAQSSKAKIISLTNDFLKTLPKGTMLYNSKLDYKILGSSISQKIFTPQLKSASIHQLSAEQRNFVDELKEIVRKNIKNKKNELTFGDVSKLEERVWNSSMNEEEKYVVLVATSIGKYSSDFWSQRKMPKRNIPRLKSLTTEEDNWFDEDAWLDWIGDAVDADIDGSITGAISGGIVGGIWGSVLLPGVGTITASIVEAVHGGFYGAVIGSAWYGFESLYDELFN